MDSVKLDNVRTADGHVEVVDSIVGVGCTIDGTDGNEDVFVCRLAKRFVVHCFSYFVDLSSNHRR